MLTMLSCLFLVALAGQAWRRGPNYAVGWATLVSLLVPTWVSASLWGLPLDSRVACGIAALSAYCLHRSSAFRTRLVLLDGAMLFLVLTHLASDVGHGGWDWLVLVRIYGEWLVPYLAGRVALQSWGDARNLVRTALLVSLILGGLAFVEAAVRHNVWELVFGEAVGEGIASDSVRWGLKRALGPVKNPIYLGTLLLLLSPWTLFAASLAVRGEAPRRWLGAPLVLVLGILATASRAPLLAIIPGIWVTLLIMAPPWRKWLISMALAVVILVGWNWETILEGLNRSAGQSSNRSRSTITVNDRTVRYTGTLHRLYLFEVYGTAMRRAGWLGFGTELTTGFPPRVPIGAEHAETLQKMWCVDNAYILMVLRFGYLGLLAQLGVGLTAIYTWGGLVRGAGLRRGLLAASTAGALAATLFVLLTVWMPHDFGFWYIWTVGAAAGLSSHVRVGTREDVNGTTRRKFHPAHDQIG